MTEIDKKGIPIDELHDEIGRINYMLWNGD